MFAVLSLPGRTIEINDQDARWAAVALPSSLFHVDRLTSSAAVQKSR